MINENNTPVTLIRVTNQVAFFTLEHGPPVIWWTPAAVCTNLSRTPDIPIAFRVIFARSRLNEPIVLVGLHIQGFRWY